MRWITPLRAMPGRKPGRTTPAVVERGGLLRCLVIALAGACGMDATAIATAAPPPGYELAWQDEFDQLSLGEPDSDVRWLPYFARWNVRHLVGNDDRAVKMADVEPTAGGDKVGDVLRQAGVDPRRPSSYLHETRDGALMLRAYELPIPLRPRFGGFPYVAGMISAEGRYARRYGYWEVRLRLDNVGQGLHFAVWLLPADGSWPPEIDLLEAVGHHPDTVFTNAHGESPDLPITEHRVPGAARRWLTVGFLWTPTAMRWTLDGKTVREQPNFIDKDLYLLMSWEVASRWPGAPDERTVWPGQISIDHVRIYAPPR